MVEYPQFRTMSLRRVGVVVDIDNDPLAFRETQQRPRKLALSIEFGCAAGPFLLPGAPLTPGPELVEEAG